LGLRDKGGTDMNVWVRRDPVGFETFDMEGIEELEEQLKGLVAFKPLDDKSEVCAEITGTWGEIRELLSQPFLKNIWFNPESPRFKP
jgi:hypothetical protein